MIDVVNLTSIAVNFQKDSKYVSSNRYLQLFTEYIYVDKYQAFFSSP